MLLRKMLYASFYYRVVSTFKHPSNLALFLWAKPFIFIDNFYPVVTTLKRTLTQKCQTCPTFL